MKNVLVTGASRGIGKCISEVLSDFGYNIFVTARNENCLKNSRFKDFCVCDLSEENDLSILSKFIEKNEIDILVNNAGSYVYNSIESVDYKTINNIFKVNSIAPAYLISCVVKYMKYKRWGRIVNIGSISGIMGEAYASLYSASKASLIGLTKALALELAEYNITINTINPGWVDTDLGQDSIEESEFSMEEIIYSIPQRRFVEPVEIANLVKYLISEEAKGLTGQAINLCAGLSVGI